MKALRLQERVSFYVGEYFNHSTKQQSMGPLDSSAPLIHAWWIFNYSSTTFAIFSFSNSRVHPGAPSDPPAQLQDPNYVPMTPLTSSLPAHPSPAIGDLAFLGRQVPPPAHMGFRNSMKTPVIPLTPPPQRSTMITSGGEAEAVPPPIHRNLKPQRKGLLRLFGILLCL